MKPKALFLEVDAYFRDCVKREKAKGSSEQEAERDCAGWGLKWPAGEFHSVSPYSQPSVPSGGSGASPGAGTAGGGSGGSGGAAGAGGGATERKRRPRLKTEMFGLPAMGPESLGVAGQVPVRNARTDAYVWANEMAASGHAWPFPKEEWEQYADRLGLMPAQVIEGWRYIEQVWLKRRAKRDNVVAEMKEALAGLQEFSGQPYGGYYLPMPHDLKVRMQGTKDQSWPWRTKAADKVYRAACTVFEKNPELGPDDLLDRAYREAAVSSFDLTPEDDALMGIALYWLYSKLDPPPTPPPVGTQRGVSGLKGTQNTDGHLTMPRGAP